jgi:glyoxylase-like metal-dependent hydrolase (beta-lactamase superfamily II)
LGCQPTDIDLVVNTHYVNIHELQFAYVPGYQSRVYNRHDFDHNLSYIPVRGDLEIAKGVHLLQTPGHTPGHQSVLVETIVKCT